MRRSGTASSSARSVASIVSSCRPRETEAKPDWVARQRRVDLFFDDLCRASGTVSRIAVASGHVVVDDDQRLVAGRAAGRRPCPGPRARSPSPSACGAGRGPAAAPAVRSPPAGPVSRTANCVASPKCSLASSSPLADAGAVDRQRERVELVFDPEADDPEHAAADQHRDHRRDGRPDPHLRLP